MSRQRGFVALKGADRNLSLRFSTNAMCVYEDLSGDRFTDILELFNSMQSGSISFKHCRWLMFAGLSDTEAELTLEDAGEIMDAIGLEGSVEAVGQAIELAFPDGKKDEKPGNGKASA